MDKLIPPVKMGNIIASAKIPNSGICLRVLIKLLKVKNLSGDKNPTLNVEIIKIIKRVISFIFFISCFCFIIFPPIHPNLYGLICSVHIFYLLHQLILH